MRWTSSSQTVTFLRILAKITSHIHLCGISDCIFRVKGTWGDVQQSEVQSDLNPGKILISADELGSIIWGMPLYFSALGTPCHIEAAQKQENEVISLRFTVRKKLNWGLNACEWIVVGGWSLKMCISKNYNLKSLTSALSVLFSSWGTWLQSGVPNFMGQDTFLQMLTSWEYVPGLGRDRTDRHHQHFQLLQFLSG